MKQYLPNKPKSGAWNFLYYVVQNLADGEPNLQSTANIAIRLIRGVPQYQNFVIYFDNIYATVPLIVNLRTQGILAVGTIRCNRIKNSKLPEEKIMMKFKRGTSQEFVTNLQQGIDVTSLSWKDNWIVNLISYYVGTKPPVDIYNTESEPLTIKRFYKKEKTIKSSQCPQIIKDYNCHMDGVDSMDSSIG